MLIAETPWLCRYFDIWYDEHGEWWLCHVKLIFFVPEARRATKIKLILHDDPGSGRLVLTRHPVRKLLRLVNDVAVYLSFPLHNILLPLSGDTYYVEVVCS